ncbi:MAG: glycosyltransferase family 1 protein [Methylocystaceae bacterium]|nr:MAG: glycosyltransferase family 1 protein [Methylocystaceae bacterium]
MANNAATKRKIDSYLLAQLGLELDELARGDVDEHTKFIYARAREFYWSVTRLLGLGHLHDGSWRKPSAVRAASLRPELAGAIPAPPARRRLLIDMTATHRSTYRTGIQRVVREIARAAVESGAGLPVFIEGGRLFSHFRHARLPDEIVPSEGDKYLLLDAGWHLTGEYAPMIDAVARAGGETIGCFYDLIPILYPATVTRESSVVFEQWFDLLVEKSDALVGISKAVIDDFIDYASARNLPYKSGLRLGWWHLGADFSTSSDASPSNAAIAAAAGEAPFFLTVGTLEPRKGYAVALSAFDKLWREGGDARYVIVGHKGWNTWALQRRIREHREFGRRLLWLDGADDADLHYLYKRARALVFPSIAEGFGLPLIEAAHFGARAIASDIDVFREVGGDWVAYFDPTDSDGLLARMKEALAPPPPAPARNVLSWRESAEALMKIVRDEAYQSRDDICFGNRSAVSS